MEKATKTMPTITGLLDFTAEEANIMIIIMKFTSLEPNSYGQLPSFYPAKEDELVSLETFKELKKAIKDEKTISSKLLLGTEQKALLLKRLNDFSFTVGDLETKYNLIEKLK